MHVTVVGMYMCNNGITTNIQTAYSAKSSSRSSVAWTLAHVRRCLRKLCCQTSLGKIPLFNWAFVLAVPNTRKNRRNFWNAIAEINFCGLKVYGIMQLYYNCQMHKRIWNWTSDLGCTRWVNLRSVPDCFWFRLGCILLQWNIHCWT